MSDQPKLRPETLVIHAGAQPDPVTKARVTPIYQTTSYVFDDADHAAALFNLEAPGNIYSRLGNPTAGVLEARLAELEGGAAALAVASGHAAQLLVFHTLLEPGCNIVASRKLYGGSITQLSQSFKRMGWGVTFVEEMEPSAFAAAIDDKTRAVFIESVANPGGVVMDIAGIAQAAHAAGVPLVVDNTLATPYLCRPLDHGADIVVHSLTKFLGGHGNSIGGAIVDGGRFDWAASGRWANLSAPNPAYHGKVFTEAFGPAAFIVACRAVGLRDLGPAISPFNAFMILTGIETLALRMERHCENALKVAQWLKAHPKVAWVSYAGLADDPNHARAQRYTPKGPGAVFTFGLKGGFEAGVKLVGGLKLFSHLANIGDTRSLVIHPASTTHRQLEEADQIGAGAGPDVVRLSVGLEHIDDILADLEQALTGV
ncbi:MAG: O-acetylhomoserine aminocarboxypropyltransferase [Phenylobacterium sp.]|uniref:O-acetylhomoserine aminocarboxypropyltransferase n=1 Tax=Phenylobacterium sp. TaxID=1871053 RepID=UPI00391D0961